MRNCKNEKFEIIVNTSEGEGTIEDVLSNNLDWWEAILTYARILYKDDANCDIIQPVEQ